MKQLKTAYHTIERFYADRPILFWLITLFLTSIPFLATWKYIKILLNQDYIFKGYEFLIIVLIPFAIIGLFTILQSNKSHKQILKELFSMKSVLEKPFEIERTWNNERYKEKYYHAEIIELFERYNRIVLKLRNKNPNKYKDLKTRDNIPKVGNDWVPVTSMQVLKSDIELLINRLN